MTSEFLSGEKISPRPIEPGVGAADLIDEAFGSYNAGRLREACQIFVRKLAEPDVTIGLSLSGALTPAGLGMAALNPLVRAGFIDWVVSTGANLYHDTHYGIGLDLHRATPFLDDVKLREEGVVRIYDILFDYKVLLDTDAFFREVMRVDEFQHEMGTAELHARLGRYVREREKAVGRVGKSFMATCWEHAVPVYTSSPGDSSIGMNFAALELLGAKIRIDPARDVNETASIVYDAKRKGGKSAVVILGGGSPKNFMLQTEPQIQEVLGIEEAGHDYFIQVTDARPDTGGLSGATPGEAVSWGKIDPAKLPDSVVCYTDSTIALPLLAAYVLTRAKPRAQKRLYDRREEMLAALRAACKLSL